MEMDGKGEKELMGRKGSGSGSGPSGKRRKTCSIAVIGSIIGIVVLIVILKFTVFKAKHPVTTVDDVSLKDLNVALDIARKSVDVNVTLEVDISVKNTNRVGFKYSNSTALLNYRGDLIGEVPIQADKISAHETKHMNLTLTVMVDRALSNSQIYSDAISGVLPLNTYIKLAGKVKILFFNIHVVTSSSCDFNIYISNRTVGEQDCKYTTKL